ncbi:MAG: hypothetical protein V7668_13955, partial [Cereibacter changlensis]
EKSAEKATSVLAGPGMRQASMQLSQVAQQTMASGNFIQALAIQLPDLALGFGAVGIMAGVAAGALLPLAANMIGTGAETVTAEKALDNLISAMGDVVEFSKRAQTGTKDLKEEFGDFGRVIQETSAYLAQVSVGRAMDALQTENSPLFMALKDAAGDVQAFKRATEEYNQVAAGGLGVTAEMLLQAQEAAGVFEAKMLASSAALGLLPDQVSSLASAFQGISTADNITEIRDRAAEALKLIQDMVPNGAALSPELAAAVVELEKVQTAAARGAEQLDSAARSATTLASIDMASGISAATDEAYLLASALGIALSKAQAIANEGKKAPTSRIGFGLPNAQDGVIGGIHVGGLGFGDNPGATNSRDPGFIPGAPVVPKVRKARGSRGKKEDGPVSAQDQIDQLNRQIEMIGMTDAKIAALTVKYQLLDEAKKRGLDLDKAQAGSSVTLREEIEQQAATIGELTARYDAASERAQFFEGMQSDLKDGLLDAIVAGEGFAGVLQDLARSFAKAALEAAIFGTGPMSGGAGFGGFLSGLFGRASGGPVRAGQAYRVNEQTPNSEIFVPSKNGAILNSSQAEKALSSSKGGGAVSAGATFNMSINGASGDDHIEKLVRQGVTQAIRQYDSTMPVRFDQISKNPRKR